MDMDAIMDTPEFKAGWEDASVHLEARPRVLDDLVALADRLALLLR